MNTLWFVRYESIQHGDIVFTFTLPKACKRAQAEAHGLTMINPDYVAEFRATRCEPICNTRDVVECFEPV